MLYKTKVDGRDSLPKSCSKQANYKQKVLISSIECFICNKTKKSCATAVNITYIHGVSSKKWVVREHWVDCSVQLPTILMTEKPKGTLCTLKCAMLTWVL